MADIESEKRSHTRMDEDNQKNVITPKPGGKRPGVKPKTRDIPARDIDETNRHDMEEKRGKRR